MEASLVFAFVPFYALLCRPNPNQYIALISLNTLQMSKSKNHTNHNQTKKQHRNGIHKPARHPFRSTKGVRAFFEANSIILAKTLVSYADIKT